MGLGAELVESTAKAAAGGDGQALERLLRLIEADVKIARHLAIPEGTVKSRIHEGCKTLRWLLER